MYQLAKYDYIFKDKVPLEKCPALVLNVTLDLKLLSFINLVLARS